jgi:hypothetical protein
MPSVPSSVLPPWHGHLSADFGDVFVGELSASGCSHQTDVTTCAKILLKTDVNVG